MPGSTLELASRASGCIFPARGHADRPFNGWSKASAALWKITGIEGATLHDRVRNFKHFTPENNPHKENDFGSFKIRDLHVFFKLDYYDKNMEFGSPDPSGGRNQLVILAGGDGGRRPPKLQAQSAHVVCLASDCRTIAIYEYTS